MNPISSALSYGYSAMQILQFVMQNDPKMRSKVQKALKKGYKPDDIINFLSGRKSAQGPTQQPQAFTSTYKPTGGRTQAEMTAMAENRPGPNLGSALMNTGSLAAGLYGASRLAGPAANLVGSYLASKFNKPSGPTPPPIPGMATPPPMPSTKPQAPSSSGFSFSSLVGPVMQLFGFKSKPLVSAIAGIVEKTGMDLQQIYDELAKGDISSPEKAAKAAQAKLAEISGEATKPTTLGRIQEQQESLKRIQPIEQIKKDLAKDLKSSVIRKMLYNEKEKKLRVIFNNDHTYSYDDVPKEVYDQLSAGSVPAKTSGSNEFGAWWTGKNPSLGASFNKLVKRGGYGYEKLHNTVMTPEEQEEYTAAVGKPLQKVGKIIQPMERTKEAAKAGPEFAGKGKLPLTEQQRANRIRVLRKNISQIRSMPSTERRDAALQSSEEMLRELEHYDSILSAKKVKLVDKENARFQKGQARKFIKSLLLTLPTTVVKHFKDKVETTDPTELLKLIRDLLKR